MLEIHDQADAQLRDAKVIEHLSTFHIGDAVDDFCVHNHGTESDEIGNELSNMLAFVENFIATLLVERDIVELELNCERVLVDLLI